ncbi:MAG: CD1375 family protein [Oscillospiraceae bacterium]
MAKIYYELIKKGLKTINDVPEKLKKQVQELLDKDSNV